MWNFANGPDERPALPDSLDWPHFVKLAQFHRVQGLAWNALAQRAASLPPDAADALSADARSIAATNLAIARECVELTEAFGRSEIPLLFVKGLTVAALAYRSPMLKMGWDIDLLIGDADLPSAAQILRARGYRQVLPVGRDLQAWHRRRKESVWSRDALLHVELHTRLADNIGLIPRIDVGSPRCAVEIVPGASLPTLARDELFAYLCVHGASSAWFRLKWITDLAALLHGAPAEEIERLYARSQELGAFRAAGQALLLADRLYGTLAGSDLKAELLRDAPQRWLADAALRQLAGHAEPREPTAGRLGTWRIHLTQLLLKPGFGFKAAELSRQVGDAIL